MPGRNREKRRMRCGSFCLAVSCWVLLGGCTVLYPLGVTTSDGTPTIIFPSCDKVVHYVSLAAGDYDRSPVYWSIRSESGSTLTEFVVGMTPPGFVEVVPLETSFTDAEKLSAGVSSGPDSYDGDVVFTIGELRDGRIFDGDGYVTRDQLQRSAESGIVCDGGIAGSGLNWWQFGIAAAVILGVLMSVVIVGWRTVLSPMLGRPSAGGGDAGSEAPMR